MSHNKHNHLPPWILAFEKEHFAGTQEKCSKDSPEHSLRMNSNHHMIKESICPLNDPVQRNYLGICFGMI